MVALIEARVAKYDGHAGMVSPRDSILVQLHDTAERVLRTVFGAQLIAHADLSPDGSFLTLYPDRDGYRFSKNNTWLQWQWANSEGSSLLQRIEPAFGLTTVTAELHPTHLKVPLPVTEDRRPPHRINGRGRAKSRTFSPAVPRFATSSEEIARDQNGEPAGGHSQLVILPPEPVQSPSPSPSGEVMVTLGNATFCGQVPVTVIARLIHQYNLRA